MVRRLRHIGNRGAQLASQPPTSAGGAVTEKAKYLEADTQWCREMCSSKLLSATEVAVENKMINIE